MDVFHLQGSISLDTTKFAQSVNSAGRAFNSLEGPANKASGLMKTLTTRVSALDVAFGNLLARGISGLASGLKSFAVSMVETSATVQAEEAQFEAAFGAVAGVAEDAFDRVGESTNILSTRLRTVGTKAFMQFSGAGIDTAESMEMMEEYLGLAADAAAAYDISLEEADTRLRSFLRGNTEAGDMINLFTSETQRNTYAMEKYGTSWLNLTEAKKQMLMLDVVRDIYDQSNVIGHAAKEGEEYSNVMQNFQETIEQTKKTIGAPITAAFTDFIAKITDFLNDDDLQDDLEHFSFVLGGIADTAFNNVEDFLEYLATDEGKEAIKEKLNSISEFFSDAKSFFQSVFTEENIERVKTFAANLGSVYEKISQITGLNFGEAYLLTKLGLPFLSKVGAPFVKGAGSFATSHPVIAAGAASFGIVSTWKENDWGGTWTAWEQSVQKYVEAVNSAVNAVGDFFAITIPEAWTSAMETVSGWWNSITGGINNAIQAVKEFFGLQGGSGSGVHASYGEIKGGGSGASFAAYSELGDTMGVGGLRGYATGLPNVPYNNFVARLHEGERVLTKAENAAYSSRARNAGGESSNLAEAIAAAVVSAMSGMQVSMDGQRVGDIVTDRVSRNIAQAAYVGRFG